MRTIDSILFLTLLPEMAEDKDKALNFDLYLFDISGSIFISANFRDLTAKMPKSS